MKRRLLVLAILPAVMLVGLGVLSVNVYASFNGQVLHVYSNTLNSFYEEHCRIDERVGENDVWSIEWDAYVDAVDYNGDGPLPEIMEIGVKDPDSDNSKYGYRNVDWYGFCAGKDGYVYILVRDEDDEDFVRTSYKWNSEHHYRVEITRNTVKFYIDGNLVYTVDDADNSKIYYVVAGYDEHGNIFSIYIDNVAIKKNTNTLIQENFDDGTDNAFTNDISSNDTDSGEEILETTQVNEYPTYITPIISAATLIIATTIYSRKEPNTR